MTKDMKDRLKLDNVELHKLVVLTTTEIAKLYLEDKRSWVIGFSGGKDSTILLQLVFRALATLPKEKLNKHVHVVCSDTMVESPYIISFIDRTLVNIATGAKKLNLPITVNKVVPEWEDTFFVNLIGKGYPSPNRWFRWCTERLKISPTTKFIQRKIEERGSVIILLGARKAESASRAQVLASHEIKGNILRKHVTLKNAFVYTPIVNWSNNDVWDFLVTYPSPWGGSNWELVKLYKDANGGECPLVIDKTTPSCGQSRFGCWVCTVVNADKSMEGFIDSGIDNLQPLLDFRNWLKEIRDDASKRDSIRRNLTEGLGPFTLEVRKEILKRLLHLSKETTCTLIRPEELNLIQSYWILDGGQQNEAVKLYNEIFGGGLKMVNENNVVNQQKEAELLEQVCSKHEVNPSDINSLIEVERQLIGKVKRRGLNSKIDEIIKRIVHKKVGDVDVIEEADF